MCANYEPAQGLLFKDLPGFSNLGWPQFEHKDVFPELGGPFIRRAKHNNVFDRLSGETAAGMAVLPGTFGLIPWWTKDPIIARRTYNARTESVFKKPAFRDAWALGQHCLIPAKAFYEPDWRSGRPVRTRFEHTEGHPMMIAGLWERWKDGATEIFSFTMLTVSAVNHPLLRNYHQSGAEKRMVVVLPQPQWEDWLDAPPQSSMRFMNQYPADHLVATPAPLPPLTRKGSRKKPDSRT